MKSEATGRLGAGRGRRCTPCAMRKSDLGARAAGRGRWKMDEGRPGCRADRTAPAETGPEELGACAGDSLAGCMAALSVPRVLRRPINFCRRSDDAAGSAGRVFCFPGELRQQWGSGCFWMVVRESHRTRFRAMEGLRALRVKKVRGPIRGLLVTVFGRWMLSLKSRQCEAAERQLPPRSVASSRGQRHGSLRRSSSRQYTAKRDIVEPGLRYRPCACDPALDVPARGYGWAGAGEVCVSCVWISTRPVVDGKTLSGGVRPPA